MLVIHPLSLPEIVQNFTRNQLLHPNFNVYYPSSFLTSTTYPGGKKMPVPGQGAESDPELAWTR